MGMAMESGHFLNAPASLRSSLRGPLEKVVTISKSLVEYGVKLGTSKKFELQSNEAKVRKHLLIEEARGTLDAFDKHLSDARRTAFYQSTGCDSNDGSPAEILSGIEDGGIPWIDHQKAVESGYVTRKFRGRVSSYFFLFNMKLYLSEALNLVQLDSGSQTAIKMHHIARFQFGPSMADLEQSIHGRNSASTAEFLPSAAAAAAADDEKRGHQPNDDDDSPPPEAPRKESGARSSTSSFEFGTARRRSAGIFSEVHTFEAVEDQKKPPVLRRQCSHRHGSINSKLKKSSTATTEPTDSDKGTSAFAWRITSGVCQYLSKWGATRAQARRSLKIALSMVVAATFGTMIGSKQEDAFWATVTVGFIIGNYQGGSWRIANLRLQGTVLGGIYGYLALTLTRNHVWANLVALIPWVVLSSFVRYSPAYGYSGLVSAFTAAILILGDFEHDIRKYAMDRITETFVGVLAFVFVETVVFPERAVRLVRNELVSSLSGLRDCVAAIVVVYTEQECLDCRTVAIHEIKQLEQQLRASFKKQNALRAEACLEPDIWFVPFPGEVYCNLIAIEGRMLDLLFFMVCSLHAMTEDCLTEHMQKLLEALRSSLTALQEEVLSMIDSLRQVLQAQVQGPSKWSRLRHWALRRTKRGSEYNLTDVEKQQQQQRSQEQPLHPLLVLNHPHRHVDGSPMNLKSTMDQFEQSFEDTVEDLIASTRVQPGSPVISNSVMLSLGSLTFSLHSLLKETIHLERAVHELVQAENPWSVLDFWDTHSVTQLWQQQASVKA